MFDALPCLVVLFLMAVGTVAMLYAVRGSAVPRSSPVNSPAIGDLTGKPTDVVLRGISVVLPAHNEEDNIAEAVRQAIAAAESVSRRQQVIVVDDGSSDATAAVALALRRQDPRVRVVKHERNLGYGSAVRSGIVAAEMEWVLLTDADLQFDLRQVREFVPHAVDSELVIGYRARRCDPLLRRLNARAWNALIYVLFRLHVRDVDAAFKLIRRDVLDGLGLFSTGATIDTELLAKSRRRGARLVELPVVHRARLAGEASGADMRVIVRAFRELFQLWRDMRERSAPPLPVAAPDLPTA
jgi:glycosyltransferase involved in cell wall biosynthesis